MLPPRKLLQFYLLHFLSEALHASIRGLKKSQRATAWKTDAFPAESHGCQCCLKNRTQRLLPSLLFQDFHLGLTTEGFFQEQEPCSQSLSYLATFRVCLCCSQRGLTWDRGISLLLTRVPCLERLLPCVCLTEMTLSEKKKKKKLLNSLFSNSLPAPEASPRFRGQGAAGGGRGAPGPPPPPRTGAALVSGFSRRQQVAASGRARCVPGAGGWGAVPVSGPRQACGGGGWGRRRRVRSGWRVGRGCLLVVGLLESDWLLGIPCLIGGVTSSSSSPSVS